MPSLLVSETAAAPAAAAADGTTGRQWTFLLILVSAAAAAVAAAAEVSQASPQPQGAELQFGADGLVHHGRCRRHISFKVASAAAAALATSAADSVTRRQYSC